MINPSELQYGGLKPWLPLLLGDSKAGKGTRSRQGFRQGFLIELKKADLGAVW